MVSLGDGVGHDHDDTFIDHRVEDQASFVQGVANRGIRIFDEHQLQEGVGCRYRWQRVNRTFASTASAGPSRRSWAHYWGIIRQMVVNIERGANEPGVLPPSNSRDRGGCFSVICSAAVVE